VEKQKGSSVEWLLSIWEKPTMKVFKAEPIGSKLDDLRWIGSTHKKWVVVRADSEDSAMTLLEWKFKGAVTKPVGVEVLTSPWGDKSLVKWSEIDDLKYSAEGKAEIIDKG
jgi:hypothetical protein